MFSKTYNALNKRVDKLFLSHSEQESQRFKGVYPHKTKEYFEENMQKAMAEGCRYLSSNGIGVIVFAHKSTAGWEAMLQAMINAGWIVTGSWAIDTEMGSRMNARNTAALEDV
jgi:adenine-specific DNA methylase